jgi:superfamily II DNA helicase RecQ
LATTATATTLTYRIVRDRLFLKDTYIVALPPEKKNIKYSVSVRPDFEKFITTITEELGTKRKDYPKTIIFCQRYLDCSKLYLRIRYALQENFTEPPSSPDIHYNHLITMYHSAATQPTKEKIMTSFCQQESNLRILIATSAFGLGIDCPDIRHIIHWGPPTDIDAYVQETGRGGRDGEMSYAHLLYGHISQHTGEDMRQYAAVTTCRRVHLFRQFIEGDAVEPRKPPCLCCDICIVKNALVLNACLINYNHYSDY